MLGLRVLRNIGMEFSAATPFTASSPRVRSHSVTKEPSPPAAKSRLPERMASLATVPSANVLQVTVTSPKPRTFASFSISLSCSITIICR